MPSTQGYASTLTAQVGPNSDHGCVLGLPVLQGPGIEQLFPEAVPLDLDGDWKLFTQGDFLLGCCSLEPGDELGLCAERAYEGLLNCLDEHHLCRIWNYIPGINTSDSSGLEHYRAFSRGRSLAFERVLGAGFPVRLPAATGVGTDSTRLSVLFAAHRALPRHFENPLQTPAYCYPADFGPRPPSFARATVVPAGKGHQHVFISGTAAIRGHRSMHPGDTLAQLDCTLQNLQAIGEACGLGASLGAGSPTRAVKIYLRHAHELNPVRSFLQESLLHPADQACFLRSDICRRDLDVEIELSVFNTRVH